MLKKCHYLKPKEINKQFIAVTISTFTFKGILIVSWKLHS